MDIVSPKTGYDVKNKQKTKSVISLVMITVTYNLGIIFDLNTDVNVNRWSSKQIKWLKCIITEQSHLIITFHEIKLKSKNKFK